MKKKRELGFTLIELLITIAVIALFFTIAIIYTNNITKKGETIVNKITFSSIKRASIDYVTEFKNQNDYWYEEVKNGEPTGNEFACTNVKQLINKGFLKDNLVDSETNKPISNDITIKVIRDKNKVIIDKVIDNNEECDRTLPEAEINIKGANMTINGTTWYYDEIKENGTKTIAEIIPIEKGTAINDYEYYIVDSEGNKKVFEKSGEKNFNYEKYSNEIIKIIENDSEYDKYGQNTKICVYLINKNDIENTICKAINLDITTPTAPTLIASDDIISDKWHSEKFNISVYGGGNSPSGLVYKYGITPTTVTDSVNDNKIAVTVAEKTEYYVQACNKVGICGDKATYIAKIDNIKPTILSINPDKTSYVTSLNITANVEDQGLGIEKYKITKDKNYVDSDWNNIDNKNTVTKKITSNGTYYVWVKDYAGNYNSSKIKIDNIDKEGPTYVNGGYITSNLVTGAIFSDSKSGMKEVKYYVSTSNTQPKKTNSNFSTTKVLSMSCYNTYYAWAIGVDKLGNISDVKSLGSYYKDCWIYVPPVIKPTPTPEPEPEPEPVCDTLCQMQANSEAWWDCTTQSCKDDLHDANIELAKDLLLNATDNFTDDGYWTDNDGNILYYPSGNNGKS